MVEKQLTPDEQEALNRLVRGEEPDIEQREILRDITKISEVIGKTEGELPLGEDEEVVKLRRDIQQLKDQVALTEALLRVKDEPEEPRQLLAEDEFWVIATADWQYIDAGNYTIQCHFCENHLGENEGTDTIEVRLPSTGPGHPNVRDDDVFLCRAIIPADDLVDYVGITHFIDDPIGTVKMWYADKANVPAGWALCDGTGSTPNMNGKFVKGSVGAWPTGTGGGLGHTHEVTYQGDNVAAGVDTGTANSTTGIATDEPPYVELYFITRVD